MRLFLIYNDYLSDYPNIIRKKLSMSVTLVIIIRSVIKEMAVAAYAASYHEA